MLDTAIAPLPEVAARLERPTGFVTIGEASKRAVMWAALRTDSPIAALTAFSAEDLKKSGRAFVKTSFSLRAQPPWPGRPTLAFPTIQKSNTSSRHVPSILADTAIYSAQRFKSSNLNQHGD